MAKIGSFVLFDQNSKSNAGVAIPIIQNNAKNVTITTRNGCEVSIHQDTKFVVCKFEEYTKPNLESAYESIQEGLDLIATQYGIYLSTANYPEDFLIWWRENSHQILRVVDTVNSNIRDEIKIAPINPQQKSLNNLSQEYQTCLRYIRLSLASKDFFDVYRYMYLALENICSFLQKKVGNEKEWLIQVLTENSLVKIDPTLFQKEVITKIYNIRCGMFHAKDNQPFLLPFRAKDSEQVEIWLVKLFSIVRILLKEVLSVDLYPLSERFKGVSTLSTDTYHHMCKSVFSDCTFFTLEKTDTRADRSLKSLLDDKHSYQEVKVNTHYKSCFEGTRWNVLQGVEDFTEKSSKTKLDRILIKNKDLQDCVYFDSFYDLSLDFVDKLELLCEIRAEYQDF